MNRVFTAVIALAGAYSLAACTGSNTGVSVNTTTGSVPYTVGGTVSGLQGGGLVLQDNYGDSLTVAAAGAFTFKTPLIAGNTYSVTVLTQPTTPIQTCTVTNGSGSITNADITNIAVMCADKTTPTDAIGGKVTGLLGSGLVLQDDGGDNLTIAANGTFVFATGLPSGTPYAVTVLTPPMSPFQNCGIADGTGTTSGADVNNITVSCKTNSNPAFTIGGTITGVAATGPIVLQDDGTDNLTVSADGTFTFATSIPSGSAYSVTALPSSTSETRTCAFTNGSGVVAGANVTNVSVVCTGAVANVVIAATVSGLTGTGLVLQDNGGDNLAVNANGLATFATALAGGSTYAVTVLTQPTGQICTVTNGTGTAAVGTSPNIGVACVPLAYDIGGTVTGLATGTQVTLIDNGGNPVTVTDGTFAFSTAVNYGGQYSVTVATQPLGEICTVVNGMGSGLVANITSVSVICSVQTFTIGGSVSGLAAGSQVALSNNGANTLSTGNGAFTFTTPVAYNGSYVVTVGTQPTGQTCTVSNGTGAGVTANVNNVAVTCATTTFTIGGNVSGLAAGAQVTLDNNGANALSVTASGAFVFTAPVAYNSSYAVTVGTQPTGQTCTVGNGTGAGVTANVTNVTVTCNTKTFTIGGTLSGLGTGLQVTLDDNGGNPLIVTASGQFTFSAAVAYNGNYAVTVGTQPTGQTCTVGAGAGAGVTANVTTVTVSCAVKTYTISGTLSNLEAATQVTLDDNGGDPLTLNANGQFTFATPIAYNGSYLVIVGTNPTAQTCSVTNQMGAGVTANVTNVVVMCSPITYSIGGNLNGLTAGLQVTLDDNGGNPLTLTATGPFTFTQQIVTGGTYLVSVGTGPVSQTCSVTNPMGTATANVTNVGVLCSTKSYTIGGSISGLANGEQVTLDDNGGDPLILSTNGMFTFATAIAYNGGYSVSIGTPPTGAVCTVAAGTGSGTNVEADVTSVSVTCAQAYTIGGELSGLPIGLQATLLDNGGDALVVTGATPDPTTGAQAFTFATPVIANGTYDVSVSASPTGYTCAAAAGNSSGTVTGNVTGVIVNCSPLTYTISGTVTEQTSEFEGDQVAVENNGANAENVSIDGGAFSFTANYGSAYSITVVPPTGATCTSASGTLTGDVTNVALTCTASPTYVIAGTVSGLANGDLVSLYNYSNTITDHVDVGGNGEFPFENEELAGGTYDVAFANGQETGTTNNGTGTCTITNPSGTVTGDVTNVTVSCTYPIMGTSTGISTDGLVLTMTTTTPGLTTQTCDIIFPTGVTPPCSESVDGNYKASYTFPFAWPGGTPYTITVTNTPTGEECTFSTTMTNVHTLAGTVGSGAANALQCAVPIP